AVLIAAVAVHPVLAAYGREQQALARSLAAAVDPSRPLLLDPLAGKYVGLGVAPADLLETSPAEVAGMIARDGSAYIALVDRSDSEFHRERAAATQRVLEGVRGRCRLESLRDEPHGALRLRVFRVGPCS